MRFVGRWRGALLETETQTTAWTSDRIADEQGALRRVATLVAQGAATDEVFTTTTAEAGRLLGVDLAVLNRYEADGTMTVLGAWSGPDGLTPVPVGTRTPADGKNVAALVWRTGRPARADESGGADPIAGPPMNPRGSADRSVAGVPIEVGDRVWGVLLVSAGRSLPASAETLLAEFGELVTVSVSAELKQDQLLCFADDQAALRRVATLVATGMPPEEVFAAVAAEVGQLLGADVTG
ncbi:GAF domain-containing protein, partial [Nonomuraea longicatena]